MSADELHALLAEHAPPGLTSVSLHASGSAALHAAIAAAGAASVLTVTDFDSLESDLRDRPGAAVVVEPAAQVARGMIVVPPGMVLRVRELCDTHGATLIADERVTGGGRSGFLWAITRDGVSPDMLVAGEGIAPGFGATMSKEPVADGSPSEDAVAAALAHLRRVTDGNFLGETRRKASNLSDGLAPLAGHPRVRDVRVRGLFAGIEIDADAGPVAAAVPYASAAGTVVIVAPPVDVTDEEIDAIPRAIIAALR